MKAFSISSELKNASAYSFNSNIPAAASILTVSFVKGAESVRWNEDGETNFEVCSMIGVA